VGLFSCNSDVPLKGYSTVCEYLEMLHVEGGLMQEGLHIIRGSSQLPGLLVKTLCVLLSSLGGVQNNLDRLAGIPILH
jgi:hypothetical protein